MCIDYVYYASALYSIEGFSSIQNPLSVEARQKHFAFSHAMLVHISSLVNTISHSKEAGLRDTEQFENKHRMEKRKLPCSPLSKHSIRRLQTRRADEKTVRGKALDILTRTAHQDRRPLPKLLRPHKQDPQINQCSSEPAACCRVKCVERLPCAYFRGLAIDEHDKDGAQDDAKARGIGGVMDDGPCHARTARNVRVRGRADVSPKEPMESEHAKLDRNTANGSTHTAKNHFCNETWVKMKQWAGSKQRKVRVERGCKYTDGGDEDEDGNDGEELGQ